MGSVLRRLLFFFQQNQFDRDLEDELRFHEEMSLEAFFKGMAICKELADAHPKDTRFQSELAGNYRGDFVAQSGGFSRRSTDPRAVRIAGQAKLPRA